MKSKLKLTLKLKLMLISQSQHTVCRRGGARVHKHRLARRHARQAKGKSKRENRYAFKFKATKLSREGGRVF